MVGIWRRIFYVMDWQYPKDIVDDKIKRQRHLVMMQIRLTKNFKLKPVQKHNPFTSKQKSIFTSKPQKNKSTFTLQKNDNVIKKKQKRKRN